MIQTPDPTSREPTKVAEGKSPYTVHQLDILAILEARNEQEDLTDFSRYLFH